MQLWADHDHPDISRLAAAAPAYVEGGTEVARGNPLAVHMPDAEAALLGPILRAFEEKLRAYVTWMVTARPAGAAAPTAESVMQVVARIGGVGRHLQTDAVVLYASRGGGMKVHQSHALVGRFEWATSRTVLHVYVKCDSGQPGACIVVGDQCQPVCVYATSCQCASPTQKH